MEEPSHTEGRAPRYATAFLLLSASVALLGVGAPGALPFLAWPALAWMLVGIAYLRPGLGIFAKREGRLRASRKLLLWPHLALLYGTWHAVRWASREPAFATLTPELLVGRRLLPGEYPEIHTLVDLTAELDEQIPAGVAYLSFPILDGGPLSPASLRRIAQRIAGCRPPIYIHCAQGHGRTAMVTSAVLVELGLAGSGEEALAQIQRVRPEAKPNDAQLRALREATARRLPPASPSR
jgi:protein-tyrosine phosphatase